MSLPVLSHSRGIIVDFTGGDPLLYAPGSGTAPPLGLECFFEFNSLFLHDRRYLDYYRIKSIDGLQDADVVDSREKSPDEDGEDEYPSHYSGRTLVINGEIVAGTVSKLRDMQQALRVAYGPLVTRPFIIRTGDPDRDLMLFAKKMGRVEGLEQQTNWLRNRDFQITLRCGNPRILSWRPATAQLDAVAGLYAVMNNGDRSARTTIDVHGAIDELDLINHTNDDRLKFKGSVPPGERYAYDPIQGTLIDEGGTNRYSVYDSSLSTSRFEIEPGENQIELDFASADADAFVLVEFNHTFW